MDPKPSPTNNEMNIYLKVMKNIPLGVKSSDTIDDIKAKVCELEGTSADSVELFYAGNHLEKKRRLIDYDIQNGSTLHLVLQHKLQIHIKIERSKTITLEVNSLDTVYNVKAMVLEKVETSTELMSLAYKGKQLNDSHLLAAYDVQSGSTIYALFDTEKPVKIFVDMPTGETLELEVKLSVKVENVKTLTESIHGTPTHLIQELIYSGNKLEDYKTLAAYNIKNGSKLVMKEFIQIFVRTIKGKTRTLTVTTSESIANVKAIIQEKEEVSPTEQRLIYHGKQLEDDKSLAYYNVTFGATFGLLGRLQSCSKCPTQVPP